MKNKIIIAALLVSGIAIFGIYYLNSPATVGTSHQFEIPGTFLVFSHGTLHVTAPDTWSAAITDIPKDITTTPPEPSGSQIEFTNANGTEINIVPYDKSFIDFMNERLSKDSNGEPLPRVAIQGPYSKGIVYFHNHSRTHSAGILEAGDLRLSFMYILSDTNDWHDVKNILESIRFEEKE